MTYVNEEWADIDTNGRPSLTAVSTTDGKTIVRVAADPATGALLVSSSGGGGTGTWYNVSGSCDGTNRTFTIPVAVTSDFLLFFNQQPQMNYNGVDGQFTYSVAGSTTTITYESGQQPFNGATEHRAFVIS